MTSILAMSIFDGKTPAKLPLYEYGIFVLFVTMSHFHGKTLANLTISTFMVFKDFDFSG